MSFEQQETGWSCGLAALKYAHSLLGGGLRRNEELSETSIRKKAHLSKWRVFVDGTSEFAIRRAAATLGLTAVFRRYRRHAPARVLEDVKKATRRGRIAIACVHFDRKLFAHWVVVAGVKGDKALVFDPGVTDHGESRKVYWLSDPDGDYVPGLMAVDRLRDYLDPGEDHVDEALEEFGEVHMFLELAVDPRHHARFVRGMVDEDLLRRMRKDMDLASSFDTYMDDLKTMFCTRPARLGKGDELAHQFLSRNRRRMIQLVKEWVAPSACDEVTVQCELENIAALCRCYRFVVAKGTERAVLARLSFWLGWTAATAAYEVERFSA